VKGYFTIRRDPYTDKLNFCKLSEDFSDLGTLSDALRGHGFNIGRLIAHDVVEHSLSHRKNSGITVEAELRAIGAVNFVRHAEFDMYNEVLTQCSYAEHRDLKPVPYIVGQGLLDSRDVDIELIRHLITNGVSVHNARCAAFHYAWGHNQKAKQFGQCNYKARNAFRFIESNVDAAIREIGDTDSWGASIYFDSNKHIFQHQMKRQPVF